MNWIKTSDRLPEHNQVVLIWGDEGYALAHISSVNEDWFDGSFYIDLETYPYWAILPEEPQEPQIKTSDRLPEVNQTVLVWNNIYMQYELVKLIEYGKDYPQKSWEDTNNDWVDIDVFSYWMPLPEEPNE